MKFELSKKFNIKGLIGVSAVALAMIGAGGAINTNNNNVHADSFNPFTDPTIQSQFKQDEQADAKSDQEADKEAEPERKQDAKQAMENGDIDSNLVNDPVIHHYLRSQGYTNHQMHKAVNVHESNGDDVGGDNNEDNRLARKADEANKALARHHSADVTIGGTSSHRAHRKHLSKRSFDRTYSAVSRDARAIKRDEKKLNTKSGRAFERNMSYYKDLQARKASLRRVVRSHHASKSAKRHARKLLRSLNKKAPRQKKMAKGLIAYYMRVSKNMNTAKANLKKISRAKRTPKNVKKYINNFLKSLNKKSTKKSHKVAKNYKKSAKRVRA